MDTIVSNDDLITDVFAGLSHADVATIRAALQIPGQVSEIELAELCRLARAVPAGGTIVEVGSLYGRSSYVWANCSAPDVKVYCIDPWERVQWIIDWVERPLGVSEPFSLEAFLQFTGRSDKIVPLQGYSPECVAGWDRPVDLYFEDAIHEDPGFARNIEFWLAHLKPGGLFVGDDFRPDYYDITRRVVTLAQEWKMRLNVAGTVFWMRKPDVRR